VRTVVTHFGGGRAPAQDTTAGRLELRSAGAVLDGRFIPLSRTGTELLGVLFEAHGAVVSRQSLQCALPRSGDNTHAVEMAVARVREALAVPDLIKTVVKRGYRLNVLEAAGGF
jgi:uroporphyrinogen-III synthase